MKVTFRVIMLATVLACIMTTVAGQDAGLPTEALVPESSCEVSGEIRWTGLSDDGTRSAIIVNDTLTVRDTLGKTLWSYSSPKTIQDYDVTLGRAHLVSIDNTVVELWLSEPGNPGVECTRLLCLDNKGHPKWKTKDSGAVVVPSPSGKTILTTDPEYMETQLLDARDGRPIWTKKDVFGSRIEFSPDGKYAAVFGYGLGPTTLLRHSGDIVWTLPIEASYVAIADSARSVILSAPGTTLQEASLLFSIDSAGKESWRKELSPAKIAIDSEGKRILIGISDNKVKGAKLLDSSGSIIWESSQELGSWDFAGPLWMSPDGTSQMFVLYEGETGYLYRLTNDGKTIRRASAPILKRRPRSGERFLNISKNGIRIWAGDQKTCHLFRNTLLSPTRGGEDQ